MGISAWEAERTLAPSGGSSGRVLHFVGRVTEEVFSFLGPATTVLTEAGIAQTIVMMDDPRDRHLQGRFHRHVDLIVVPADGHGAAQRWKLSFEALLALVRSGSWHAVHLHGFLPCVLGSFAVRAAGSNVVLHYSPHGSRSLVMLRYPCAAVIRLLWPGTLAGDEPSAIAGLHAEACTLGSIIRQPVEVVEHAVELAFFDVVRHETPFPLVVTGGSSQDPLAARDFEQVAVLLGGEALSIAFNWIGTVDRASAMHLEAANVGVTEHQGSERRASRLAASWVYVATGSGRGFPLFLAEAMCVGLPCVATDTPAHRDMLIDGETGFLCTDQEQMLTRIGQLIDDAKLRRRLGEAARTVAWERFAHERFRDSLRLAYGM